MSAQAFEKKDYSGGKSTLCTGCGHDLITTQIIQACFELQIDPDKVFKMSGIGCSSKLPGYFLSRSYGFNSMHGRMAPVATGAKIAQHHQLILGVSGDGDSASIGLGGFAHLIRRNVPMVYLVANNGVYGLTKGQFSATADRNSALRHGQKNSFDEIDICGFALELGAPFVARAFVGDLKGSVEILKSAMQFQGLAVIDVISPCVAFNNHEGSTKSFDFVRKHVQKLETPFANRSEAQTRLREVREQGQILTGILYSQKRPTLIESLQIPESPLVRLTEKELRPARADFENALEHYR